MVKNASRIDWNNVVEFSPFTTESNSSSYFQWAIALRGLSVRNVFAPQRDSHTHLGVGERNTSRPDAHIPSVNSQFIFGPIRHVCDVVTFFIFFNLVILSVVLLEFMDHFQMYDPFSRNHWSLFDCALGISYI